MSVWLKALFVILFFALPAQARNLAFVLGNDVYQNVPPLQKARADAEGYAGFFAEKGFEVHHHSDLDQRGMVVALAGFLDAISPGDTVVFAFSGHGWSNGSENFLVPVDIRQGGSQTLIEKESFVLKNGFNGILDEIARRGPALTVAIIDACRDNPFQSTDGTRSLGLSRGLVPVQAPTGTFIAFSAGEGQTALDRLSDNDGATYSVFTRNFLDELNKPQDLQAAFKATQLAVNEMARTIGHAQRPAYYDEVVGSACLTGRCVPSVVAPIATPVATPSPDAAAEWQDFRNSNSIAALQLFADRHAGSAYAALALERIVALKVEEAKLAPAPQAPPIVIEQEVPLTKAPVVVPDEPTVLPGWCPNAGTVTEKTICATTVLAEQDVAMTKLFLSKRKTLSGGALDKLKRDQRAWLSDRNACKNDIGCLAAAYESRIRQLQ